MLLRGIARPLLAGVFISGGIAELRDPEGHAKAVHPVVDRVAELVPMEEPPSNVTLVRVDAGVKISAGLMLALRPQVTRFTGVPSRPSRLSRPTSTGW